MSDAPLILPPPGRRRRDFFPYYLILPTCLGVLLVDVYPFLSAFGLSFQGRIQGRPVDPFVGLDNYRAVLTDAQFWSSLWVTIRWTLGAVAGQLVIGTALAVLVHGIHRGQKVIAALLLIPWVTPLVVAALTCKWILHPDFGVINTLCPPQWLGLSPRHDWLGDPATALPAVIAAQVWKYYGFVLLIVLARLKTLPDALLEAARIDGAGRLTVFFRVVLPQIWDVLAVTVLLMCIWTFNTFDMVYLMAPGVSSTRVLAIDVYRRFAGAFDYGMASATAVLMFTALFGVTLAYARRQRW